MFATELNDELTDIIRFARKWDQAECRGSGDATTSLWFSEQIPDIVEAKAICGTCALVAPCLQGALDRREPWGVWGGELFANGKVLAQKRRRGRPPKDRTLDTEIARSA